MCACPRRLPVALASMGWKGQDLKFFAFSIFDLSFHLRHKSTSFFSHGIPLKFS